MTPLLRRAIFCTFLISFAVSGFGLRAEESAPPSGSPGAAGATIIEAPKSAVSAPAGASGAALTPGQFKTLLPPGNALELHLQDFLALRQKGPVVVVDVRSKPSFDARHLKGSVNMPLSELTEKTLPAIAPDKNVPVVLACEYSFAPTRMIPGTMQAYPVLKAQGYTQIYRLNLWDSAAGKQVTSADMDKVLRFEGTATVK